MKFIIRFILALVLITLPSNALAQVVQTFRYDGHGRLAAATTAQDTASWISRYDLDAADNRIQRDEWDTGVSPWVNGLPPSNNLVPGMSLTSTDGRFKFTLQQDGNIVLMQGSALLWQSATATGSGIMLRMHDDGGLNLWGAPWAHVWGTGTAGNPGAYLIVQNNGNVEIRDFSGTSVLWQTNTCCH